MGVYKEIAKADGSGITTFYRLSEENSTVETTSTGTTETMFDYNDTLNKPSINDVALVGNKTLDELGIQPAGDYITEIPVEYITEEELEAKDYATEAFVIEQINNAEHFHREIVDALPLTGKDNILYLVPKKGSDKDIYNEYIWTGVDYEFMGTTAVDLTDYYQKNEVDELLDNKVNKVDGKQLSTNDYTTAEKTKLASLENYDDSELRSKVDALHNYDDTAIKLDIQDLKKDVSTNEIDITSIENELGYKAEVIRLVKNGDWWLCQDAKGNNLTLEMAMNRLGLPKTILLLENLENDGKYYPVEYELQEKYIDIIYKDLDGITHHLNYGYNEYFTNTASGDYIFLEDSINYPYKELSVDGVCEQETTSGKNLLNPNKPVNTATDGGITITNNGDGTYTVKGTSTKALAIELTEPNIIVLESGKTYSNSIEILSGTMTGQIAVTVINSNGTKTYNYMNLTSNQLSVTKTTNENLTIERYDFYVTSGVSVDFTFRVQLEEGTPTPYEPYTGGQPSPSPDYPQEIKTIENSFKITSCNKNILKLGIGSISVNNTTLTSNDNILNFKSTGETNWAAYGIDNNLRKANYGDYIAWGGQVLKAGTYTLTYKYLNGKTTTSTTGSNFLSINVYGRSVGDTDRVKTNLCRIYVQDTSSSVTFTIDEDKEINAVVYLYASSATIDINFQIQLEKGSTATTFEQHLETQIQANLPEGEFIGKINDTYKDTLKVEYNEEDGQYHLVLNKMISKVVLDGSEGYWVVANNSKGLKYFYRTINDRAMDNNVISNNFTNMQTWSIETNVNAISGSTNNKTINIMLEDTSIDTKEQFSTWLSTHNTEVYYALAEPYTVDLGIVDMPITYNEITNLFTDSDLLPTINIEYYTEILENAKDNIIGQDTYLQDEVDTLNDLPTEANKGDIRKVKDTEDWYIYDGSKWSAFDKASEVDLSNYLAKDNTVAYKPATDYNPSTKKYVDDSIADIFIPTKISQLTNDSGFVSKSVNDLTNYYNKSNTYNKAEVNALVSSSGGITKDTIINTLGYTPYDSANPSKYISKIPTASSTVLGGVKIGNNLSIDANGVLSANSGSMTEDEVNSIIDNYGTKVNLQVGDKLGEKALSYEFPNDIENSINTSTETLCSTTYDSGGIIMISTYSNKLQYRYIDDGGGLSTQELCTISNGAFGDLTNIPAFDIEEVNTSHYLYPYLFFKNQPISDRIENLEENSSKETSRLTIQLDINGPTGDAGWTVGTDNIEINYIDKNGRFVSEKWYPTDITSSGENKIIDIAKGTTFSITSTYNMTGFKKYGVCTNIQPLYKDTSSTEVTCFIYKDGLIWFWDGEAG